MAAVPNSPGDVASGPVFAHQTAHRAARHGKRKAVEREVLPERFRDAAEFKRVGRRNANQTHRSLLENRKNPSPIHASATMCTRATAAARVAWSVAHNDSHPVVGKNQRKRLRIRPTKPPDGSASIQPPAMALANHAPIAKTRALFRLGTHCETNRPNAPYGMA